MNYVPDSYTIMVVDFSDVFSGLPKALQHFTKNSRFIWGQMPHSLVDPEDIVWTLEFMESKESDTHSEILEAIKRLEALPDDVLVLVENADLEN